MSDHYRFGGGAAETMLSPIVLVAMLVAIASMLLLPRKFLVGPFLLIAFMVPSGQMLVVSGVHLYVIRIVILAGIGRLVAAKFTSKASIFGGGFNTIDKLFLCWAISRSLAFMLLYGKMDAVVNQFGFLWDSLGGYFFLRFAIRDEEDISRTTKLFALMTMILAVCMVNEQRSTTNVFGFIGGRLKSEIRDGKLRSQGPFSHSILAGVFGATILPLFLRLWSRKKDRLLAIGGIIGATTMVITSASSTPFGAYMAGVLGICLWPLRRNMRVIRWGIVFAIVGLALVMKAPVWFLLAHIDLVGGSSSYHRAQLVDQCIRRFGDWWLLGANNNQDWGWDMWDIQNEFVAEALRGGLAALLFFVLIISKTFSRVGSARRSFQTNRHQEWLTWILGAIIFAHVIAFVGADYFDQTRFWWYTSLAFVSATTASVLKKSAKRPAVETADSPWDYQEIAQPGSFEVVQR
jgi:hypothetical protein